MKGVVLVSSLLNLNFVRRHKVDPLQYEIRMQTCAQDKRDFIINRRLKKNMKDMKYRYTMNFEHRTKLNQTPKTEHSIEDNSNRYLPQDHEDVTT